MKATTVANVQVRTAYRIQKASLKIFSPFFVPEAPTSRQTPLDDTTAAPAPRPLGVEQHSSLRRASIVGGVADAARRAALTVGKRKVWTASAG